MIVKDLADRLFPDGHSITFENEFFYGVGCLQEKRINIIGTRERALIGVDLALRIASQIVMVMRDHPGSTILLLVDTAGQKMSRRDELLGLNGYIAHVAKCLEVARGRGHKILGLVSGEAVSAGFLSTSMLADACYALPGAEVRVMNLKAMSRVTKIPVERLELLSERSPVFAPGVSNYFAMGAIAEIWDGDLSKALVEALGADLGSADRRRQYGEERRGRSLAKIVSDRVRYDPA
ncbi:biotin-independent malonate decarboxylase subunit gamma [Neorhizobium sp. P12A]|uniref:biotin-independent malonate decarboxylase subunit gamma n=1 Tax=Neorhizobium sp. P12A TaxID=2268027 RepID=UPI0011EDCA6C|nr:biotin-independent malonate decarboxylase subunit gamma [Neorhizobium sp. P12A]KAA0686447.1 biotin-independent malonate decarboxylase subunit gamma [Neorhizobium sp. P12A]